MLLFVSLGNIPRRWLSAFYLPWSLNILCTNKRILRRKGDTCRRHRMSPQKLVLGKLWQMAVQHGFLLNVHHRWFFYEVSFPPRIIILWWTKVSLFLSLSSPSLSPSFSLSIPPLLSLSLSLSLSPYLTDKHFFLSLSPSVYPPYIHIQKRKKDWWEGEYRQGPPPPPPRLITQALISSRSSL